MPTEYVYPSQPSVLSSSGVNITIGIMTKRDRTAIVLPCGTDNGAITDLILSEDAGQACAASILPLIAPCLAENCWITHISCEPMMNGKLPWRALYGPADFPGTVSGDACPSQVSALLAFYGDPAANPGIEVPIGKTNIAGIGEAEVAEDIITSTLYNNLKDLLDLLCLGWPSVSAPSANWYRYVADPQDRTSAQNLMKVGAGVVREYVSTQRRRLIPRF